MFKNAATKIAHNSTLPQLAVGNKDLKPLQDLITAEKLVLSSLQRLSVDFGRAAEALKIWGQGEGDDLGDTLTGATNLLSQFTAGLSEYSQHENSIREQMKSIRSREESLDEAKRRRKAVVSKADASEKKLTKMSPEHKNLAQQTDQLNRLRDEIRQMDSDIMTEEAALGDFKRSCTRSFMFLKFGGLQQLAERGTIIGEYGKMIVGNIPQETTQPGYARSMYQAYSKTSSLVEEASHSIKDIGLSSFPEESRPSRRFTRDQSSIGGLPSPGLNAPTSPHGFGRMDPSEAGLGIGEPSSPMNLHSPQAQSFDTNYRGSGIRRSVDDFGVNQSSGGEFDNQSKGGQFATFPVNSGAMSRGMSLRDGPPSINGRDDVEDSFSSSVEQALKSSYGEDYTQPPPGPPPGAAAPALGAYDAPPPFSPTKIHSRGMSEEGGLAYMNDDEDDKKVSPSDISRKGDEPERPHLDTIGSQDTVGSLDTPASETAPPGQRSPRRVPPPTFDPNDDERSLNAAAAREVGRELDSLMFNAPSAQVSPDRNRRASESWNQDHSMPSPLAPPTAPFTRNSVSPRPSMDRGRPSYDGGHGRTSLYDAPVPTAQSTSPTSYGPPGSPTRDEPSSPMSHHAVPSISLSESRPGMQSTPSDPSRYGTPFEYPRNIGASKSNTSLSSTAPIGSGTGKISAAAFRRPQNRMGSQSDINLADTSPLHLKKQRGPSGLGREASPGGMTRDRSGSYNTPRGDASSYSPAGARLSGQANDEDFDYIGAYVNNAGGDDGIPPPSAGSPPYADYGSLGKVRIANASDSSPGPNSPDFLR